MKTINLKEQRLIQVSILDAVVDFCNCNNLRYFLAYGTTIGAVRHHGYIPWDDDIDICMPRADYDYLLQHFDADNSPYKTISLCNSIEYGMPFAKVHDTRTLMDEHKYQSVNFGVYIDVFPLDGVAHDWQIVACLLLRKVLNCKKSVSGKGRGFIKDLIMSVTKVFLIPLSVRRILLLMDKIGRMKPFDESEYIESFFSSTVGREKMKKIVFDDFILQEFEGKMYRIPVGYDTYLRQQYGDYMKLPPLEKQVSHHDSEAWWKE